MKFELLKLCSYIFKFAVDKNFVQKEIKKNFFEIVASFIF
jgi:hypothetical protein